MAEWLVGASLVCPRCLERGVAAPCPRCGGPMEDLATSGGFDRLASRWRASRAYLAGRSLLSPRAIVHLRLLLGVSVGFAAVTALAPVVGPAVSGKTVPAGAELALALGVGVVLTPFTLAFYALFLFAWAHVCRLFAMLAGGAAQVSPIGTLRFSLVATIFRVLSRPLLPQVELVWPAASPAATVQRGTLAQPLTLHLLRDSLGFIERFDAWLTTPVSVTLDGQATDLTLSRGTVSLGPTTGTRSDLKAPTPDWLSAPRRPGTSFSRELPAGTPVTVERRAGLVLLRF